MRETPYQANRALAVLSKMLQLAEVWGFRPMKSNPCYLIEKFKERPKERYLSEAELSRLGEVLAQVEREKLVDVFVVAAIRLLIFTGARVSEILNLQWQHVDLNNGTLRLPDSKTGAKVIFLSVPAANVLKKMPKLVGSPWVIPSEEPENPWVNINKPWLKIREMAKLEGVRIHDLRHTFASIAVQSGLSLEMVGGLLGHSQASTTKRYSHLSNRFLSTEKQKSGRQVGQSPQHPEEKAEGIGFAEGKIAPADLPLEAFRNGPPLWPTPPFGPDSEDKNPRQEKAPGTAFGPSAFLPSEPCSVSRPRGREMDALRAPSRPIAPQGVRGRWAGTDQQGQIKKAGTAFLMRWGEGSKPNTQQGVEDKRRGAMWPPWLCSVADALPVEIGIPLTLKNAGSDLGETPEEGMDI